MGKFMRKAKITQDVPAPATMDLSLSSLGVRTRAKTLALQKLHSQLNPNSSYLELRSRKLEKHPPFHKQQQLSSPRKHASPQNPNPRPTQTSPNNSDSEKEEGSLVVNTKINTKEDETEHICDFGGENDLVFYGGSRETTPIRESDTIWTSTPGSSTSRPRNILSSGRNRNTKIPCPFDMDEFFKHSEREEQRMFMEKYNFDVVNDVPLKGRYEWVRL